MNHRYLNSMSRYQQPVLPQTSRVPTKTSFSGWMRIPTIEGTSFRAKFIRHSSRSMSLPSSSFVAVTIPLPHPVSARWNQPSPSIRWRHHRLHPRSEHHFHRLSYVQLASQPSPSRRLPSSTISPSVWRMRFHRLSAARWNGERSLDAVAIAAGFIFGLDAVPAL